MGIYLGVLAVIALLVALGLLWWFTHDLALIVDDLEDDFKSSFNEVEGRIAALEAARPPLERIEARLAALEAALARIDAKLVGDGK